MIKQQFSYTPIPPFSGRMPLINVELAHHNFKITFTAYEQSFEISSKTQV